MKRATPRPRTWSLAVAVTALLLTAGPTPAAIRIGTDGDNVLIGTKGADQLTGKGGDDLLKGLAGDDVYYFKDGWGDDTLEEKARYKVGKQRLPGGTDTLSFAQVTAELEIVLIRQWGLNRVDNTGDQSRVALGSSVVENAVLGPGGGYITGGGESNTLQPGGDFSSLKDFGGHPGDDTHPPLPASDDTYKGFGAAAGNVYVVDWAGAADLLDLRAFSSVAVYVDAVDLDEGGTGTKESLQIVTGSASAVFVIGHFGDVAPFPGAQGQIERVVFADGTFGGAGQIAALAATSADAAAATARGADLARAAQRLAAKARRDLAAAPPLPGEPPRR